MFLDNLLFMRAKTLDKKANRILRRQRDDALALERLNEKKAIHYINRVIIKGFPGFILDHIKVGTVDVTIDINSIVRGGKAIGTLVWKEEWVDLVVDRLIRRYPSFDYTRKGNIIIVTYDNIIIDN